MTFYHTAVLLHLQPNCARLLPYVMHIPYLTHDMFPLLLCIERAQGRKKAVTHV